MLRFFFNCHSGMIVAGIQSLLCPGFPIGAFGNDSVVNITNMATKKFNQISKSVASQDKSARE
jgi:hypothetical protein